MNPELSLGGRLKAARHKRKLTQHQLGQMAELSGEWICAIERGTRRPDLSTLLKVASALNVSTDYLLGHTLLKSPNHKQAKGKINAKQN